MSQLLSNLQTANDLQMMQNFMQQKQQQNAIPSPSGKLTPTLVNAENPLLQNTAKTTADNNSSSFLMPEVSAANLNANPSNSTLVNSTTASLLSLISQSSGGIKLEK